MGKSLEDVTEFASTMGYPNRRPRNAATLILVDRSRRRPKVLLGKRHATHAFLPGKYVFPGGMVDPKDRFMPVAKRLHPQVEMRLMSKMSRPTQAKAQAFALTAIRETYEETGILIGSPYDGPISVPQGPWHEFAKHGYYPDLSVLHLVARAITPPRYVRRFDARFFTADASNIAHRISGRIHSDAELVDLKWMPIDEAWDLDLPDITQIVLHEIKSRIAVGFHHELPVPFFRLRFGRFVREIL